MKTLYITKPGRLKRRQNTLFFIYKENGGELKKSIPITAIDSIFALSELDFNTKLFNFLSQNKISVHFFNYYGYYTGSFYPRKYLVSGFLVVKQVKHYLNKRKRLGLAKEFVKGAIHNSYKNLYQYKKQGKKVEENLKALSGLLKEIEKVDSLEYLMALEGNAKDWYYKAFGSFLGENFKVEKRVKRPPDNMINSLISFGNSLVYSLCLSQIYHTQLDPSVSFLHQPGERRYSLALDIADVFKPVLSDRLIFKLINNNMINEKHFLKELNFVYLNDKGRRLFIEEFEKRLETTVKHQRLNRNVSYRHLVRLECYKLIKHLVGDKEYSSYKSYW